MSTRDELAAAVQAVFDAQFATSRDVADALIAEGWRKKPSEAELESALAVGLYKHILNDGRRKEELHGLQVREILALMDGGQ